MYTNFNQSFLPVNFSYDLKQEKIEKSLITSNYYNIPLSYDNKNANNAILCNFSARISNKTKQEKIRNDYLTECINKSDKKLIKKIGKDLILRTDLPTELTANMLLYFNQLNEEEKSKLRVRYLTEVFSHNYSYAFENNANKPVCGTKDFKPFSEKSQLKKELASMKKQNGEWRFKNSMIEHIINNDNDISELSLILNKIASQNIQLSSRAFYDLLTKEGITLELAKSAIDLYKSTQNDKEYEKIKDACAAKDYSIIILGEKEVNNVKKNLPLLDILEKCNLNFNHSGINIISLLKDNLLSKKDFEKLLSLNLYPQPLSKNDIIDVLKTEKLNDIKPQNIKFLEDIKHNPKLKFLYDKNSASRLSNKDITEILTMDLSENFNLKDKKDIINFIDYLHSKKERNDILGSSNGKQYVEILTKNTNDNIEDGKKLVKFILDNGLTNNISYKYLTNHSFSRNLNFMSKFNNNPLVDKSDDFLFRYIPVCSEKHLKNCSEAMDIAAKFDCFKNCHIDISNLLYELKDSVFSDYRNTYDKDKLISDFKNLDKISKEMPPMMWQQIKGMCLEKTVLSNLLSDKNSFNLKEENIKYLNNLYSDEKFQYYFDLKDYQIVNFLQKDLDIKKLQNNKKIMFDFMDNYVTNNKANLFRKASIVEFDGDFEKLQRLVKNTILSYPSSDILLNFNNNNDVILEIDKKRKLIYNKDIELIYENIQKEKKRANGVEIDTKISEDKKHKQKHYITRIFDPKTPDSAYSDKIIEKFRTKYYDETGDNILKTRIYKTTDDGFLEIKEVYPEWNVKNISVLEKDENGIKAEKHLKSINGTISDILYNSDKFGNDSYSYIIKDKNGKELTNLKRTTKIIDDRNKVTTVNGRKYYVKYTDNEISVYDFQTKSSETLDLEKINPQNEKVLNNLLNSLSGDELLQLKGIVNEFRLIQKVKSGMDADNKTMYVGPNVFVIEHETGHAKDYYTGDFINDLKRGIYPNSKIASDKKLQEIYMREKKDVKENLSNDIIEEIEYFLEDDFSQGSRMTGLREVIAEANALQSSGIKNHPDTLIRSQIVQENFPETIAYLINNHLL